MNRLVDGLGRLSAIFVESSEERGYTSMLRVPRSPLLSSDGPPRGGILCRLVEAATSGVSPATEEEPAVEPGLRKMTANTTDIAIKAAATATAMQSHFAVAAPPSSEIVAAATTAQSTQTTESTAWHAAMRSATFIERGEKQLFLRNWDSLHGPSEVVPFLRM
jgi:hypothetical protein